MFDTLNHELNSMIHALSVEVRLVINNNKVSSFFLFKARTPLQWETSNGKTQKSPPCLGGMKLN